MPTIASLYRNWRSMRLLVKSKAIVPRRVRRCAAALARHQDPIVLGPWLSEVGFELLYWIPLVRRLFREFRINPERVIAISRGGAAPWYEGLAHRYCDVFETMTPADFVAENNRREAATGLKKQLKISSLDERILSAAVRKFELGKHDVFHPQLMYRLFFGYWSGYVHHKWVLEACRYDRLRMPDRVAELPFASDYVAVKFYFSQCFPETPENVAFIRDFIRRLAKRTPVVLLNTGLKVDDHADSQHDRGDNVFDATNLMTPTNNLAVQTALVAHAKTLFCTYGGFSYLAPLLGKPCTAFYSDANFVVDHFDVAHEVFNEDLRHYLAVLPTHAARDLVDLVCS